jgi:hypothetical protein
MPTLHSEALTRRELSGAMGRLEQVTGVQFPFHTMWRMLGEGIYAVAMEPTTNRDTGRFDARTRGALAFVAPGEARRYDLEIGVLDGTGETHAFAARVGGALAGSSKPVGSARNG